MMKNLIGAFCAASLAAVAFPTSASAVCQSPLMYAGEYFGGTTFGYLYGAQYGAFNSSIYYGYTPNSLIAGQLATASANHSRVILYGDSASCATGTYIYVGTIIYIWINP